MEREGCGQYVCHRWLWRLVGDKGGQEQLLSLGSRGGGGAEEDVKDGIWVRGRGERFML